MTDKTRPFHAPILRRLLCAGATLCAACPAAAFEPGFPGTATVTSSFQEPLTSYRLPIGPWREGGVEDRLVEGGMEQTAWRIAMPGLSTLALMAPLREQLAHEGWQVIYECETVACGGYDFRYAVALLPEPDMHVDLGDFRYLAASRGDEALSLMVSRSAESGFVQLTRMVPGSLPGAVVESPAPAAPALPAGNLAQVLESQGALALDDLVFASGAAELAAGDYASLAELAAYLAANPARRVALVGHTDASGSLQANVALSRKRAQSVRALLIARYGVAAAQVDAEGVGYLAPRASNLTEEGRTQNRRVEVMLTSTQ